MRRTVVALAMSALLLTEGTAMATGSAGHPLWRLDGDFGSGGIVSTDFPGSGHRYAWGDDSVVEPNGRTVVVGVASTGATDDAAVARYLPDGSLDRSFGEGGRVTIGPHALYRPTAVATQSVGGQHKILVAVATTFADPYRYRCSVIRLNANGTLDTDHDSDPAVSFGRAGIVVVTFPGNSGFCGGMSVADDGKVLVTVEAGSNGGDVGVFRLLRRDGALDPGFGGDGRVTISAPGFQAPGPVALQPGAGGSARVLVGGLVSRAHGYDWAIWRLRSDGLVDPTFGHGGRTVSTMYDDRVPQSFESVRGLLVEESGDIVAAGDYRSWPDGELAPQDTAAVAEYTPAGKLDRGFGGDGRVHMPYDARGNTSAQDVSVDAQGRVLYGGALSMPTSGQFLVGGFTAEGAPDRRFGTGGYLELIVGGGPYTGAASISTDPAGRLVLAGVWGDPAGDADRFGLVRLLLTTKDTR